MRGHLVAVLASMGCASSSTLPTATQAPLSPAGRASPIQVESATDPGQGVAPGPATVAAAGAHLVIWDGAKIKPRNVGSGRTGTMQYWDGGASWADCHAKPSCKATLAATPGAGIAGHKGLKFHAEGAGWSGAGWSWFDWYPPTAGTDVSHYANLTFQVRVEAASPDAAPDPANVSVSLVSSNGKKTSARAIIQRYDAGFNDGKWHKIKIPMSDLRAGEGAQFDPTTAWEFRLSTWNAAPRDFNVDIDQIAAEK